jgi:two-component system osmolarity sensor histidine kinase EnvZ
MRLRLTWLRLWARSLKRWAPTSLFARSLLIIVLPVAVMQVAVTWAFFEAHWQTVSAQLSEGLASDVAWDVAAYQADPSPAALAKLADRAERTQSLSIALQPGRSLPTSRPRGRVLPVFDQKLRNALDDRMTEEFWLDSARYPTMLDIRVKVTGGVMRIIAPRDRAFAARGHVFIMWMAGATFLLTAVAIAFIRNQVRAIERLADAAEAFGKGIDVPNFKPHGAREVRKAAVAFIDMKTRIQRHIEQRTTLLASVSHDLRTPLTRLKLEAELAPPEPRMAAIKQDLAEMEHMIDEFLAFARGEGGEPVERVELGPLLQSVVDGASRAGASVSLDVAEGLSANLRPNAIKRALSNLVMNAATHASQVALTARSRASSGLEIVVDDNGPGIAEDMYDEAFKPFSRLDSARNQNVKGVGLGLAIARDVARSHGGDIELARSPMGGLRAMIKLPG